MFSEYRETNIPIVIYEADGNKLNNELSQVNENELVEIIEREKDYSVAIGSNVRVVMSRGGFYIDHSF